MKEFVALSVVLVAVAVAGLAAYQRWPDREIVASSAGRATKPTDVKPLDPNSRGTEPRKDDLLNRPIALIENQLHDFGVLDPMAQDTHEFVIRNKGNQPLILKEGPTTCDCTALRIVDATVVPGSEGVVHVDWTALPTGTHFFQVATVRTNDPFHPDIRLKIEGKILPSVVFAPPLMTLPRVSPGTKETAKTLVFSQVWDDLVLTNVESSIKGLHWSTTGASDSDLAPYRALSGQWLEVTIPANLPQGIFSDALSVHVQSLSDTETNQQRQLELSGKVLRSLAIYGKGIDANGVVDLGFVHRGEELEQSFLVKIRDAQQQIELTDFYTKPNFVKVRFERDMKNKDVKGLYNLVVEIPADAPPCNFRGKDKGSLQLEFDHPRIADVYLPLRFAVVEKQSILRNSLTKLKFVD